MYMEKHTATSRETRSPASDQPAVSHAATLGHFQKTANVAVNAMVEMLKSRARDGQVSLTSVERVASVIMGAQSPLTSFYELCQQACHAAWALAEIERKRTDYFGRLLVEPFAACLDTPHGIERTRLPQFFDAVRMMLGEEEFESQKARATLLAQKFRGEDGMIDWIGFHAAPAGQAIIEHILVAIARSFRRFEPRKDWFLVVLNSTPNSVSVGPSAFAPKNPNEKVQYAFSESHMCAILSALFDSVRLDTFDDARTKAFTVKWGIGPDKIFGPFFVELLALSQRN